MNSSDSLNFHSSLKHSNEVRQICKPLLDLIGINHFMMTFYYFDGSITRLSTCPEWTSHYYRKEFYNIVPTLNKNDSPANYSVWDYLNEEHKDFLKVLDDGKEYKISRGFTVIKHLKAYKLICSICTPKEDNFSSNVYLENLMCIDNFIYYFLNKAHPIIEAVKKSKIYVKRTNTLKTNDASVDNFYKSIDPNRIYFKNVLLSKQETSCLLNLMVGKTSKQISKILKVSSRTIDAYIDNIKLKTNCSNRTSIIEEANQSELFNLAFSRLIKNGYDAVI